MCAQSLCPAPLHPPPHLQSSAPCFVDPATATDMTASRLDIAAGQLPAGAGKYTIALLAAKGARTDTDATSLRVLAGAAPTGTVR